MKIELRFFGGCPHEAPTRQLLMRCLERAGIHAEIEEKEGDYPSPSILVDGVDVMGDPPSAARACRLDLPTEERLVAMLSRSAKDA